MKKEETVYEGFAKIEMRLDKIVEGKDFPCAHFVLQSLRRTWG